MLFLLADLARHGADRLIVMYDDEGQQGGDGAESTSAGQDPPARKH